MIVKIITKFYKKSINQIQIIRKNNLAFAGLLILIVLVLAGIIGPLFLPYDIWETCYDKNGKLEGLESPSLRHPFGTTFMARDILSQTVIALRSTLIIGLISGAVSVFIGASIGLISGYKGGWIDTILMRLVDVAYGMPFVPFMMVLVAILGRNIWIIIGALICIVWRSSARVVRAQVMSLKEEQFIMFAKARGCSETRVIIKHLIPNLLPILFLYTAINMVWSILAEAGISFLGFGDPDILSLGGMFYDMWMHGVYTTAWWWLAPPAISIVMLVSSIIFISQAYEEITNPKLKDR